MLPSNGQGTGDRESARWQITMPALLLLLVSACSGGPCAPMDPPDRDGIAIGARPVVRRGDVAGDEQGRVVLRDFFFDLRVAGDAATAAAVAPPPRRIIWSPRRVVRTRGHRHVPA